ncbi:23S rRNA (pseudouridine(1915)-N(3))-methyltransferase RlmH [Alloalcanivorax xenomutans]|uniref:23S rRNA (pseudouridine(1915)-N(3))-methyltransferase RlmH n=1 Tax=Alloalcanivorax xenomutans TaxID=1094342 RepID=UPI00047D58E6|nr:23S rRNA (pseudouridine(1915)-N(3))-methyltransferase RlmH [Alloalcanivorax xenomutans]PHS66825.1 MAG: 23S rRNA (pseudouridine(1915)-N(3))-methyltransferase RlmH [Alcanivorax sp.]MCE7522202.1 23S rRNA (pseudouridine(1915)-N(3))-methyltransferase RlmH [Alloalcanivorax xenomutans]WOA32520.1 23S rRNA (pseudouridine(1915)-N(3))-methyltransferase RlmH [Alloalcanivorax xenomutans]CUR44671.1 LSU m3Psi1915 methyltransferase RlmH [Alloalcanivorax xenomutans]SOC12520.1 23S rRNA (pseudouridine1915-N3)
MRIHLFAVGTRMPAWVEQGFQEYQKRLPPDMRLLLEEIPLPKRAKGDVAALVRAEGEAIRKRLEKLPGARVVALEVTGKAVDTPMLSQRLGELRDLGQDLALLVGGPDGLCARLSADADERWSLSALTLPHPLVRVLLAEQLYRGWTLLAGHPYHR